jgi:hypothetical protein
MIFPIIIIAALILSIIAIFVLVGVSLYFSIKEHKRILKEIDDENDF